MAFQPSSQVVTSATSPAGKSPKQVYLEWTDDETRHLVNWLSVRDKNHDYTNYHLYLHRRAEAAQRILTETDLVNKPGVTPDEISTKLTTMFTCYRMAMELCVDAGWGVGEADHNRLAVMTDEMESEAVIEKCFFYYNFHVILGGESNETSMVGPCRSIATPRESDQSAIAWWRGQKPEEVPRFEWELK